MSLIRSILAMGSTTLRAHQLPCQTRNIKRWVAPTLREIRKRRKQEGPEKPINRTSFTDWNPNAELFAFSKRLSEDFKLPILQKAFIHESYIKMEMEKQKEIGIEDPAAAIEDNQGLVEAGTKALRKYVEEFVQAKLSSAPAQLQSTVTEHLLSNRVLSKIAKNLGAKDLILSAESTPSEEALANTFRAIVAALAESSGDQRANSFVRDFVCTELSQFDWAELWQVENPYQQLQELCATAKMAQPEPRLIGQCGANTLLASYNVAIYSDKKMIGSGFGETVDIAKSQASLDALRGLYKIRTHQQSIRF